MGKFLVQQFLSRGVAGIFVRLAFLFVFPLNMVANQEDKLMGYINGNIPIKAEINKPFEFYIWLTPNNPKDTGMVKVYMSNDPNVTYEPSEFTIKAGERQKVTATILRTSSGLAVIGAEADNWYIISTTVDVGFFATLSTNLNLSEPIESRRAKSFYIKFLDKNGNAVQLDAVAKLSVEASKIELHAEKKDKWVNRLELDLDYSTSSTPVIEIRPTTWKSDIGVITVELRSYRNFIFASETYSIAIMPPWYIPLLMAILGGILYSISKLLKEFSNHQGSVSEFLLSRLLPGIIPGILAGVAAYLLADLGVLGIKVDTTTLHGFVILGFLFSYVGLDMVLKAATQRKTQG